MPCTAASASVRPICATRAIHAAASLLMRAADPLNAARAAWSITVPSRLG